MQPIRGRLAGRQPDAAADPRRAYNGERRLLAAIIVEAIRTAQAGGAKAPEAAEWLATVGCEWGARFLHIEGIGPTDWQRISVKTAQKIISADAPPDWDPARGRRYRERLQALGVQRMRDL